MLNREHFSYVYVYYRISMVKLTSTFNRTTRLFFSSIFLLAIVFSSLNSFYPSSNDISIEIVDAEEGDSENSSKLKEVETYSADYPSLYEVKKDFLLAELFDDNYSEALFVSPDLEQATPPPDRCA